MHILSWLVYEVCASLQLQGLLPIWDEGWVRCFNSYVYSEWLGSDQNKFFISAYVRHVRISILAFETPRGAHLSLQSIDTFNTDTKTYQFGQLVVFFFL